MKTRFWIKLYLEILDDPKMGLLPDWLWRRAIELFLLAGENGNDGLLQPVTDLAWRLRVSAEKLTESLLALSEVGVVHETEPGVWIVTHFEERQTCESYDRVKRYRERYRNGTCNGEVAAGPSTSTSTSESISDSVSSEEGVQGEEPRAAARLLTDPEGEPPGKDRGGEDSRAVPNSPVEAMLHPDVRVFAAVTGGRIPGLAQYRTVIETVRFLRGREKLDDQALERFLAPYWLAWSGRKRMDGRPYDPSNISWLTEWAVNSYVPPNAQLAGAGGKEAELARSNAEVIQEVARRKNGRGS